MTDPRDARLQAAYRSLGALEGAGEDCPTAQQLWSAMQGELPRAEALDVLDHVSTCTACIAAWQLARDLAGEGVPEIPVASRKRRPILPWALATAAVLVLGLVTLPFLVESPDRPDPSPTRSEVRPEIFAAVEGDAPLSREQCVLSWTAPADAASYRVDVTTGNLDVLFTASGLTSPEARIPAADLDPVPSGGTILWRVEATLTDGTRITSATFSSIVE